MSNVKFAKQENYSLVIFDVDGTLLDTSTGLLNAVKYTIRKFNMPTVSDNVLRSFIGPPVHDSFARTYNLSGDKLLQMVEVFRDRYKNCDLLNAHPYDGIFDVLDWLRANDIRIAIATYKREDYAVSLLRHFHFDEYADVIHGADADNKLKKADIIQLCIDELGVHPQDSILMIGDTDNDAVGAEKLGIDFLAVSYGFGFRKRKDVGNSRNIGMAVEPKEIKKIICERWNEND